MIEFVSITQASIDKDTIPLLAEASYDESILGSNSSWIVLPYFAKPVESNINFDNESEQIAASYNDAIANSAIANSALQSIVKLSGEGKRIVIGCYDYNVNKSHLTLLFDLIEEKFMDEAPELRLEGR